MNKRSKHSHRRGSDSEFQRKEDFDWDVTSYTEGEVERTREIVLTEEDLARQAAKAEAEAKELVELFREEPEDGYAAEEPYTEEAYIAEEPYSENPYPADEYEPESYVEEEYAPGESAAEEYEPEGYASEEYEPERYEPTGAYGEPVTEDAGISFIGEDAYFEETGAEASVYEPEEEPTEEPGYLTEGLEELDLSDEGIAAYTAQSMGQEYDPYDYDAAEAYGDAAESAEEPSSYGAYTDPGAERGNPFRALWEKILDMETFDKIVLTTGAAVVLLVIAVGSIYMASRADSRRMANLADVGTQLDGINLIGEKGLVAVADARLAQIAAANALLEEEEEEENTGYDELDYDNSVTVRLEMTSVLKDLKIKFTNKSTGKLVANVPFSVTVTDPDGKTAVWTDDDMDGIIYKKGITAGDYKVSVNELADEKYEKYTLPTAPQTVEVKKDIAYEKIDVSNEVKTEAEINVAQEDTKKNETVVESTLQDTVTWLESTAVATTYTEVPKSSIPDPMTLTVSAAFRRLSSLSGGDGGSQNKAFTISASTNNVKLMAGKQATVKMTAEGYTEGATLRYTASSLNSGVASTSLDASGNLVINAVAAGTTRITISADYASGDSAPSNVVTIDVTVTGKKTISLDKTTLTVFLTEPATLKAVVTDDTNTVPLTVVSSDTNIVQASANGRVITVNGVAAGTATVTVSYKEDGEETQAACTVVVKEHPKNDKTNKLKDANGQQLYVMENDTYREAVYADYYTAAKFFIKGEPKYTGWQTIDGKVYYYDADGKRVTGEQVIQGAKYNFASDGTLVTGNGTMGIDVSKWNGNIDWQAVKNSGVSYVIIRCGYRGSSKGMLVEDPKFATNIKGATAAGLKVGVYFFTQAVDEVEAVEEASYVLDKVKNYKISYPIFLDVESSGGRADKIDKTTRTAVCKTFCETVRRGGYTSGIYANKTWLNEKIDTGALGSYKIWLAQYAATPTYSGRYEMWQYKSTGKVSGISGNVDMNISYLGY